jgi:predicted nucleic acid-binding protein
MILIDSDVAIELLRGNPEALAWLGTLGRQRVTVPGFVAMEMIQGCRDRSELDRTQRELSNYDIVWPDPATCDRALSDFRSFWLSHRIGFIDALIGHTALAMGQPLHSFNVKHLGVISGLQITQPYIR